MHYPVTLRTAARPWLSYFFGVFTGTDSAGGCPVRAPVVVPRGLLRLRFAATFCELALPFAGALYDGGACCRVEKLRAVPHCHAFRVHSESRLEQGCGHSHRLR